jgi:dUTPase
VVDEDYRGIINVILINNGSKIFTVKKEWKFAQLKIEKIVYADCELAASLEDTKRGSKCLGPGGYK